MENNIVNLSLKKEEENIKSTQTISDAKGIFEDVLRKYMTEEEIESLKQAILYDSNFNRCFKGFAEIISESFDKISKSIADVVECFSNSGLTTKNLADMFPANNKLKMQGKPMRRYRAYAKNGKKQKKI